MPEENELERQIALLADPDGRVRQQARLKLVEMEGAAVPALVEAMASPSDHARWEAAKALAAIAHPASAPALVKALEDRDFGVRWLAAEGLVEMGDSALPSLFRALERRADSAWLRDGAHHVLRLMADGGAGEAAASVMAALEGVEPELQVPLAARAALDAL